MIMVIFLLGYYKVIKCHALIHIIKANETDEPGEEHIIDKDIHGEADENLFHYLVADGIVDPNANHNNPNMEGVRQGAGQQGPQRM